MGMRAERLLFLDTIQQKLSSFRRMDQSQEQQYSLLFLWSSVFLRLIVFISFVELLYVYVGYLDNHDLSSPSTLMIIVLHKLKVGGSAFPPNWRWRWHQSSRAMISRFWSSSSSGDDYLLLFIRASRMNVVNNDLTQLVRFSHAV